MLIFKTFRNYIVDNFDSCEIKPPIVKINNFTPNGTSIAYLHARRDL